MLNGGSGSRSDGATIIGSRDTPGAGIDATHRFPTGAGVLQAFNLLLSFQLDVAAQTTDVPGNSSYWGEAGVQWSFNGNGTVTNNGQNWASNGAGVTSPQQWASYTVNNLMPENVGAPIFNPAARRNTFNEANQQP